MTTCNFYLFGPPRLTCNGKNITINLRKALALLAYLVVNPQPHSRTAAMRWRHSCGQTRNPGLHAPICGAPSTISPNN